MNANEHAILEARPVALTRADLNRGIWSHKTIFRHGQCDPAGIVYTPEFFNIFNQAIEAWFCDCLGISYYDLLGPRRTGLGYVNASATFFVPCMMGNEIEVFVTVVKIGTRSYQLCLHAMKGDNEVLRGYFTSVITSLDTHRPINIPQDLRQALRSYVDMSDLDNN